MFVRNIKNKTQFKIQDLPERITKDPLQFNLEYEENFQLIKLCV